MNEPRRWLDPDSDASEQIRRLLLSAQRPRALDSEQRERVRRALQSRLANRAARWADWFCIEPGSLIMVTTSAMAVAYFVVSVMDTNDYPKLVHIGNQRSAPAPAVTGDRPMRSQAPKKAAITTEISPKGSEAGVSSVTAVSPVAEASSAPVKVKKSAREKARKRIHRRGRMRRAAARRRAEARIAALVDQILKPDARLLELARASLAENPARSLRLIREYRRRYPESPIPIPSAMVEINALRMLGHVDLALAQAQALADRVPRVYHLPEVDQYFAEL